MFVDSYADLNKLLVSIRIRRRRIGSGQGLSVFATDGAAVTALAGIVLLFRGLRKSENAALSRKMLFPDGH